MTACPLRIVPGSPTWPAKLDHVDGPPGELWLRGRAEVLGVEPRIAVVGTRSPTAYGEAQARRFAAAFARAGISVVSGLARGVDQAAHAGALDAAGPTVAVLASGVDRPWPTGPVADAVLEHGVLVSEYPPGQDPRRHHFPLRNRLISGLADAVLVVEAAFASGSLITARWAVDQGRAVFALPGRIDHPLARGTLRLIREGATPVESPEELLSDLYGEVPDELAGDRAEPAPRPRSKTGNRILGALKGETLSVDELSRRLSLTVPRLLVELVDLELGGSVARGPGGLYRLS